MGLCMSRFLSRIVSALVGTTWEGDLEMRALSGWPVVALQVNREVRQKAERGAPGRLALVRAAAQRQSWGSQPCPGRNRPWTAWPVLTNATQLKPFL